MGLWSQLREDYRRHAASSSHRSMPALATYRFGQWVRHQPLPVRWVGGKVYGAALLASETISGIFLDRDTQVGEGIHFVHAGGINIHPNSKIGNRVGIMQGVTLGGGIDNVAPIIEDDVFIGANATIIGNVRVGAGASVAANSLVVNDVPPGYMAIGVPAKNVPQITGRAGDKKKQRAKLKKPDGEVKADGRTANDESAS